MIVDCQVIIIYIVSLFQNRGLFWLLLLGLGRIERVVFAFLLRVRISVSINKAICICQMILTFCFFMNFETPMHEQGFLIFWNIHIRTLSAFLL